MSFCLATIVSCILQGEEVQKKDKSCSVTWRKELNVNSRHASGYAYFYNGGYLSVNDDGRNKLLSKLRDFKGKIINIEVPYLPAGSDVYFDYPNSSEIPFFDNKKDALQFLNVLKTYEVVLEFGCRKVVWPKQLEKEAKLKYNAKQSYELRLKPNNILSNKKLKMHCTVSWNTRKDLGTDMNNNKCNGSDFLYNGKSVGINYDGYIELMKKLQAFEGDIVYIELPFLINNPTINLPDNFYALPFLGQVEFDGISMELDDFVPLIKSKGLTVKLKFPEKKKDQSKTAKELKQDSTNCRGTSSSKR